MEEKYSYYIQMREILKQIQKSVDAYKMNELANKYINLDIELRKLYNCDDSKNPHYDLDQIEDNMDKDVKKYELELKTIRNSIESGSTEYSEDDYDEYESSNEFHYHRFNCIHSLIIYRNDIDKKYYE